MKRAIKQKRRGVLVIVPIVVMVLMPFAPCRADWMYIGSAMSSGLTRDSYEDPYGTYGWSYNTTISPSTGAWGASVSGESHAGTWVFVTQIGAGSIERNPWASITAWGESYYAYMGPPPPETLYVTWSISASGIVECYGSVYDWYCLETGSLNAHSRAISWAEGSQAEGFAFAEGNAVSCLVPGDVWADVGGIAVIQDLDWGVGDGWYGAKLVYTVNAGQQNYPLDGRTTYTALAEIWTDSRSYGRVTIGSEYENGQAWAGAWADCWGSASTSVSQ